MNPGMQSPRIMSGQLLHAAGLVALLTLAWIAWQAMREPFAVAFWAAIAVPVMHQVFVWLAWRLELRGAAVSKTIGFTAYLILFFIMLAGRVVALWLLASLDSGSLHFARLPRLVVTLILTLICLYTGYSLKRYFGFIRAAGADHFDPRYREMPLVDKGIFRFARNGMYVFGFMVLWAVAIGFNSLAAIVVAAFSHIYIWIHFSATEKPDMEYLYGTAGKTAGSD